MVIAIDGFSGTGKSSTAKEVARKLGYTYIDTGAMYRSVTLFFLQQKISCSSVPDIESALNKIHLDFNEGSELLLNGQPVGDSIRTMQVSEQVSTVSAIPLVRKKMVDYQRKIGERGNLVMDGRDIGTVVFPNADLKVFMTADVAIRARRRQEELEKKGIESKLSEITANLKERDRLDSTREESPLRKADNAIEIDTSDLTFDEQVHKIVSLVQELER
ncbi:MAG: (d)CMP kinase [Cyclobacteriaceae bacterium]|nr:(d)CMP kinase [Cyclobacteriaceae bacterium HetDA_MAG_MS6]